MTTDDRYTVFDRLVHGGREIEIREHLDDGDFSISLKKYGKLMFFQRGLDYNQAVQWHRDRITELWKL